MLNVLCRLVSVLIAASVFAFVAFAQAVSGNIAGTVQDTTGAAVANASITITDLDRGAVFRISGAFDGWLWVCA